MIRFESPSAFFLLVLLPAIVAYVKYTSTEKEPAIVFADISQIRKLPKTFRGKIRTPLLLWIRALAFIAIVIALARPQTGFSFQEADASGKDILLTLDLSGSMQAMDFFIDNRRVNRLQALQHVVSAFIDKRQGDRMGLVVFGDESFTQSPLTLDHEVLKQFVSALEIGMAGQGTAIGDALAVSLNRMKDIKADSKVILLVTDGKNNSGSLNPKEVAELANRLKIKIHVIGIGSSEPAPFPVSGIFGTQLIEREMDYDEETLKIISSTTGGLYFNARDTESLLKIYQDIDSLESRKESAFQQVLYDEEYVTFLLFALVLLLLTEILSATVLIEVP